MAINYHSYGKSQCLIGKSTNLTCHIQWLHVALPEGNPAAGPALCSLHLAVRIIPIKFPGKR